MENKTPINPKQNDEAIIENIHDAVTEENSQEMTGLTSKLMESLSMISINHSSNSNELDIKSLEPEERAIAFRLLEKNEDNAFAIHSKMLDNKHARYMAKHGAANKRKHVLLISIIAVFTVLTIVILFLAKGFLTPWFTFVGGLAGGFGLGQSSEKSNNK